MQIQKSLDLDLKPLGSRVADARIVIDELYKSPIINAAKVEKLIGKSPASAYKLIAELEAIGILKEITGGQRGRIYIFKDYVDLFK